MYNPMEINRIDRQIDELQRLKASYQQMSSAPQPINNIINTPQPQQPLFEARFTTENPSDIYVQNKTAFIDLKNGRLSIKEVDGEIKEYFLLLPKDEKDLRIESLEMKLKEMEAKDLRIESLENKLKEMEDKISNGYAKSNQTIINESTSRGDGNESTSKSKSKNAFFKSNEQ